MSRMLSIPFTLQNSYPNSDCDYFYNPTILNRSTDKNRFIKQKLSILLHYHVMRKPNFNIKHSASSQPNLLK